MKVSKRKRSENIAGFLFIAPLFLGLIVFFFGSFFQNIYFSFTNKSSFGVPKIIGLDNYTKLLQEEKLVDTLVNTVEYVILCVPVIVIFGILMAQLINTNIRGKGIYRTLLFVPAIVLPAAISLLFRWLFNYQFGLFNVILSAFQMEPIAWLSDPLYVIPSISAVLVWSNVGYQMIILLAGLQGIDNSYYEAAKVDGASDIQSFFKITLPLLTPTIFFVTTTITIGVFQIFDFIYMMMPPLSGGVAASRSLVSFFYEEAFVQFRQGYAASISMVLFVVILIVTLVQMGMQKKWVHYE